MIDDKKIEAAKEEIYEDRFLLNGEEIVFNNDEKEEMFYKEDIKEAIGLGAKWAINELLKDLWHLNSEEPRKGAKFLYQNHYNSRFYYYIGKIDDILETYPNWSSYVKHVRVIQWLYIDDLFPKKGGGEQ